MLELAISLPAIDLVKPTVTLHGANITTEASDLLQAETADFLVTE